MKSMLLSSALWVLACASAQAGETVWLGHWKLDPAQSHFSGDTMTFSPGPNGLLHFSDGSTINYDFGLDGKSYPAAYNRTTIWTQAGKNAWDQQTQVDGKTLYKSHRQLSADEKTLTMTFTGTQPDGSALNEELVYERVSGTKGLLGKWKSIKVQENAPPSFIVSSPAAGSLRFEIRETKTTAEGAADGTDHAMSGPQVPPGMTIGYKLSGNQIHYTIKMDGKPDTFGIQTMATDGRSFTDVSWSPGKENEKQTAVYIKQKKSVEAT
jgi:hypothetical protein